MKLTQVAAAVIERPDGSFLLGQRASDTFYAGYWEFPGGKVEAGETPREALVRELREELGIEVLRADPWVMREHVYEHAHVRLHFFRVSQWQGVLRDHVHADLAWQAPGQTMVAPMLPANAPVLKSLILPSVYGITHAGEIGVARQLAALAAALGRGLRWVQLREPALAADERLVFARAALALCRQHGARLMVNDDDALARAIGADGLHVPARRLHQLDERPDFEWVAASCHDRMELERANQLGLDFAVLGPVKATASHPGAEGLGWAAFGRLVAGLGLPVYALGGLSSSDIVQARENGGQGIAAIRGAWNESA